MEERINTARTNEVIRIDSLTLDQRLAVAKLRRLVADQGVSTYAVGALCQRNKLLLERMTSARKWAKLSPASREVLIAEIRERLHPHAPELVCVWSHWAEANDVECVDSKPEPPAQLRLVEDEVGAERQALLAEHARKSNDDAHPSKSADEVKYDAFEALAAEYGMGAVAFARWCQGVYAGPARGLPDRDSEEGVELADCGFQIAMPVMPTAIAAWRYRRRYGKPINRYERHS